MIHIQMEKGWSLYGSCDVMSLFKDVNGEHIEVMRWENENNLDTIRKETQQIAEYYDKAVSEALSILNERNVLC
jgi:hypothetical protein